MTRAEQRMAIFDEFNSSACECECEAGDCIADQAMADEIIRLRGERDALRYEMHDRMNKLHRVLGDPYGHLTEEVARLSRILAALRNPSKAVTQAVFSEIWENQSTRVGLPGCAAIARAAVAAAEQEASRDQS